MSDTTTRLKRPVYTVRLPDGRNAETLGLWKDPRTNEVMVVCRAEGDAMLTVAHPSNLERISPTGEIRRASDTLTGSIRRWADPQWRGGKS